MSWPLSQDYNEAVQNAATCFSDPDMRKWHAAAGALGIPIPRSGNFADVYQIKGPDGRRWAVKCFTRKVSDLQERYAKIDAHLRKTDLPFNVGFSYLSEGVRIRGQWYPVVKMEWVEGFTLNEFTRENVKKPALLAALLAIWVRLAGRLRDARVTHADLQHGNVLLVPGASATKLGIKLIDYDGMWIPALSGQPSGELGHPAYQHPARIRDRLYSAEADRFPELVIATALRGLIVGGQELWRRFDNGDNMLFREDDFKSPSTSLLMKVLWSFNDPVLTDLLGHLVLALDRPLLETPWIDHLMGEGKSPALTPEQHRAAAGILGVEVKAATIPAPSPTLQTPVPVETDGSFASAIPEEFAVGIAGWPIHPQLLIVAAIAILLLGIMIGIAIGIGLVTMPSPGR